MNDKASDADDPSEQDMEALRRRLGQTEHDRRVSDRALLEQCYKMAHELAIRLESAFTGGDLIHHRRWHERQDLKKERWRRLCSGFSIAAVMGIFIGVVVFLSLKV